MKCFLLELRVIFQETNNKDIRQTIDNLIVLANSSLPSDGVSSPIVTESQQLFWACLGEVVSWKASRPSQGKDSSFQWNGIPKRQHHNPKPLIDSLVHKRVLRGARQCAWGCSASGHPVRSLTSDVCHQAQWVDINLTA